MALSATSLSAADLAADVMLTRPLHDELDLSAYQMIDGSLSPEATPPRLLALSSAMARAPRR